MSNVSDNNKGITFNDLFRFRPGDIVRHRASPSVSDPVAYMVTSREAEETLNGFNRGYYVREVGCDGNVGKDKVWWAESEAMKPREKR